MMHSVADVLQRRLCFDYTSEDALAAAIMRSLDLSELYPWEAVKVVMKAADLDSTFFKEDILNGQDEWLE
eukprot:CAMPEP_0198599384 /NCGR_PEP_ID=MMETSP1462-20131121/146854_1 /TAXON_ID=1333877 /ORGANISM="Brandtodinium nutriculum, Strain RCC3387" /LENGTH=69 /DNA_ID=CAMNT_0044331069 /DNA_START=19 /DNA_END=225 /DNA_ORIENTATION=-